MGNCGSLCVQSPLKQSKTNTTKQEKIKSTKSKTYGKINTTTIDDTETKALKNTKNEEQLISKIVTIAGNVSDGSKEMTPDSHVSSVAVDSVSDIAGIGTVDGTLTTTITTNTAVSGTQLANSSNAEQPSISINSSNTANNQIDTTHTNDTNDTNNKKAVVTDSENNAQNDSNSANNSDNIQISDSSNNSNNGNNGNNVDNASAAVDANNVANSEQNSSNSENGKDKEKAKEKEETEDNGDDYKLDPEKEKLYHKSMSNLKDLNHYAAVSGLADRTVYKTYKTSNATSGAAKSNKANFKKVLKEIQTNLPENITVSWNGSMFVRYDEDYPQFLQCILTGLIGTPYENGVFLFDLYLDSNYPTQPPKIQHTTKGATLVTANNGPGGFSPNLHKSTGKVCLSLLGTWHEGETWKANESNVYQVLSTILFMIFGAKYPYYMEPGHGGWEGTAPEKDHEPEVIEYNEELYYGTLKYGILDVLKTPYVGFEEVIANHFKLKKDEILNCIENKWIKNGSEELKNKLNPLVTELKQEFEKLERK